jgi:hypothetical protein
MGELPTAALPVKTGTVLVAPPEVVTVVCAVAATAIIVNPSQANTPFVIVQSLSIFSSFYASTRPSTRAFHISWREGRSCPFQAEIRSPG